jgi:hypothetical protein
VTFHSRQELVLFLPLRDKLWLVVGQDSKAGAGKRAVSPAQPGEFITEAIQEPPDKPASPEGGLGAQASPRVSYTATALQLRSLFLG